ncbi:MAG TPA: hypothetical protein VM073_05415 [Usitatibacter sp.]|nr:hypothetical protein [Usitatibacter sp.]
MKTLALLAALSLLSGCATFDDPMDREVDALHAPDMQAAIDAARPGEPR